MARSNECSTGPSSRLGFGRSREAMGGRCLASHLDRLGCVLSARAYPSGRVGAERVGARLRGDPRASQES